MQPKFVKRCNLKRHRKKQRNAKRVCILTSISFISSVSQKLIFGRKNRRCWGPCEDQSANRSRQESTSGQGGSWEGIARRADFGCCCCCSINFIGSRSIVISTSSEKGVHRSPVASMLSSMLAIQVLIPLDTAQHRGSPSNCHST